MARNFDIKGFAELDKVLQSLPDNVHKNALAAGLRGAGRVIVKAARRKLPSNLKKLKSSYGTKILRKGSDFTRTAIVGARTGKKYEYNGDYIAHIIEYGTFSQRTEPLKQPRKRRKYEGRSLPQGLRPTPHLRPAIDETRGEQLQAISVSIKRYLDRYYRR